MVTALVVSKAIPVRLAQMVPWATKVSRGLVGCVDLLDSWAKRVNMASAVPAVTKVKWASRAPKVSRATMVCKVLLGRRASPVLMVPVASVGSKALKVSPASHPLAPPLGSKAKLALMVTKASQGSTALSAKKGNRVNRVTKAHLVTWAQRASKANRAFQESLGFQVRLVRKDHVDCKEKLVPLDHLDPQVRRAMQESACLVNKVHRGGEEKKGNRVQLESQEIQGSLVFMARMGLLARTARMDFLARMAWMGLVDHLERKANRATLVMRSRMSYKFT